MEYKESYLCNGMGFKRKQFHNIFEHLIYVCMGGDTAGTGSMTGLDLHLEKPRVQWRNPNHKIIVT